MQSWSSWAQEDCHGSWSLILSGVSSVRYAPVLLLWHPGTGRSSISPDGENLLLTLASSLQHAARKRLGSLLPLGATLIEFETQSMLQSNCIVNQCFSEPRQRSGPSSRCAGRDVQCCNLLLVRLHCSEHPLGRFQGVLRTFILMQTHWPEAQMLNCGCKIHSSSNLTLDILALASIPLL